MNNIKYCLLIFILLTAFSCSQNAAGNSTSASQGISVTINGNHGHILNITQDDITAGIDKTYDIQGTATHTHSVTITAADFTNLKNKISISETSTTTLSHNHLITVSNQ
jgi:hypothetical protein